MNENALVRLLGWRATILHGDPMTLDRWRWLRRHLRAGRLRTLDAGCGSGAFTMYAAKIGNEAVGITFDPKLIEKARARANILGIEGVSFIQADLRRLDQFELGTFDQVICFETIEHILDDRKLIADLARLLVSGGRLLLTTPYKLCPPLLGDHLSSDEDGGHVRWGYTHAELRELFAPFGLTPQVEEFVSGVLSQSITNLMRRLTRLNARIAWVVVAPLRLLQIFDPMVSKVTGRPAASVAVVAVKSAMA